MIIAMGPWLGPGTPATIVPFRPLLKGEDHRKTKKKCFRGLLRETVMINRRSQRAPALWQRLCSMSSLLRGGLPPIFKFAFQPLLKDRGKFSMSDPLL